MKSLKKILSGITSAAILATSLMIPSFSVSAATTVNVAFEPDFDAGSLKVKFSGTALSGTLKATIKDASNGTVGNDITSGTDTTISATDMATLYNTTIKVTITNTSDSTTADTTYKVPDKSTFGANDPAIDPAKETISNIKAGSDMYVVGASGDATSVTAGTAGVWSKNGTTPATAKVFEDNSIPTLSAEKGFETETNNYVYIRKVEDGKFMSEVKTVTIAQRAAAPAITVLDIDFTKEQLKPKDANTTAVQYSVDGIEGPYANLTTLNIADKKNPLLGEKIHVRVAPTASVLASKPLEYTVPERADTPEESVVATLFDRTDEEMYHNVNDAAAAGGTTYEYRANKKDTWKAIPQKDGTAIDLSKLGSGLDKGIKKLEIRRAGTNDSTATSSAPATLTENALMASESFVVDLIRPKGPKKNEVKFVYANYEEPNPSTNVVVDDDILGQLIAADATAPELEIATYANKKAGEYVDVATTAADKGKIDGSTVYSTKPSGSNTCDIVIGNTYAIRYKAVTTGDDLAFASKPTVLKIGKQKKAGKFSYVPLTETMKGVKDGQTLYYESTSAKFADDTDADKVWNLYTTTDANGDPITTNPFEPADSTGADKYFYFRTVGVDDKNPAGAISLSVKVPKKAATPVVTLGTAKPTSEESIVVDMTAEKVMVQAGKIAYRITPEEGAAKIPKWKIIKKAEMPLKTFIPKTEEIKYQFIVAGDAKGSMAATKSNSDPFEVKFEPRPENPVAEDISYAYNSGIYTAGSKALLISADGKTNWTSVAATTGTFDGSKLDKPVAFKIAPVPATGTINSGDSIGVPASAKAFKFKFMATPAAPIASLTAASDGKTATIDDAGNLEWAATAKATKWNPASSKTVKDGETIYVRTPASAEAPASKPAKLTWKAVEE